MLYGQFYMHSLPRNQEEIINDMLRDYKKCKVELVDDLETGVEINFTDFAYDPKEKDKYNRAKKKQEDRKEIERGIEEWDKD